MLHYMICNNNWNDNLFKIIVDGGYRVIREERRNVNRCKTCPYKEGCYKEGSKERRYYVTIISEPHSEQAKFQEAAYFKEKARERYKIEAKNSELKNRHGYDVASSSGLVGMEMQGALTIFAVNLKRILKLINEK